MRSRSWNAHRNGVNAPRSIDVVPSHTMCEMMAHFARDHAQHRAAWRDRDAHEPLGGEGEPDVVRHRRQVIRAVGERNDLVVVPVLPELLEAGVEVPKVGDHPDHGLTVQLDEDRKSTRLNSSHVRISYAVFCLKKKKKLSDIIFYLKKKKKQTNNN